MTQEMNLNDMTVETKRIFAWDVELFLEGTKNLPVTIRILGNDFDKVCDVAELHSERRIHHLTRREDLDLSTDTLETKFDKLPSHWTEDNLRAEQQYKEGLSIGKKYDYITLSMRGVWGAGMFDRSSSVYSYETIGFHAHTKALVNGFIDSGTPILDYRLEENK